ncbi:MAG: 2-oxoacid:acceptor oxidoreductase subunit alpha [Terriglobales bacterium]
MATADVDVRQGATTRPGKLVNDFSLQVATVNGSGSQSSNLVLLRTIFQMGIPVSGKNLFPSNIAGLPTWYTIRANKHHYVGRKKEVDFLVALNSETAREDIAALDSGAAVLFDEPLRLDSLRDDLIFYPVPFDRLVATVCPEAKLRKLVRNMIYDGVLAHLLHLDLEQLEKALRRHFKKKPKAADLNWAAVRAGYDYARQHLAKQDRCWLEPMHENDGKIVIEGNAAAALGCLFAGVTVVGWYPITPSSSLCENLISYLRAYRTDPVSGEATFAVVQAEDELASAGIVLGAGWMGARAMTSTSGPGISLMAEFVGLGYFAELPGVFFDVQRVGPSTGMPTRTSQGDLAFVASLGHGDSRHIVLLPGTAAECYSHALAAFDLAEEFQTPIFVLSDLDLAMNHWIADPLPYPEGPMRRGKVLDAASLDRVGEFARYRDVDGDGIPYRTLPGTEHPAAAYFTRGSGHNDRALYSEKPHEYVANMDRLRRKYDTARSRVPAPVLERDGDGSGQIGIIAFGSSHFAVLESLDQLSREARLGPAYLRLRALPFNQQLRDFVARHQRVYVVEQNRDAQMLDLIRLELAASPQPDAPDLVSRLRSVRHYNGLPVDARSLSDEILRQEAAQPLVAARPARWTGPRAGLDARQPAAAPAPERSARPRGEV